MGAEGSRSRNHAGAPLMRVSCGHGWGAQSVWFDVGVFDLRLGRWEALRAFSIHMQTFRGP
jgi:hypothetical protein